MIGLGIGIGISISGAGAGGAGFPSIQLSALTIAEDAAGDTEIGTASVANAPDGVTYTWAITADPDSKFAIVEATGVLSLATLATLNFESASSHQVTIEATPSAGDPPPPRTFNISVTNVIEAPVNTVAPVVSGALSVGSTLSCTTGTWTDMGAGSYAYQWKDAADDSNISGATASTLLLTHDMVLAAMEVYCEVTATNAADSTAEPSNTVGPVVGTGTVQVGIFAGQSNMVSVVTTAANLPVNLQTATDQYVWTGTVFEPLVNSENSAELSGGGEYWGPDAEFGRQWAIDQPGVPLYMVKVAAGGTSLAVGWADGGTQRTLLTTEFGQAKAALEALGYTVNVPVCCWMQGESDSGDEEDANAYYDNLLEFFDYIRETLGDADTAIIVGEINYTEGTYYDVVTAAQAAAVADTPGTYLVETGGFGGGLHFTAEGIVTLGAAMYDGYEIASVPDVTAPVLSSATFEATSATTADAEVSTTERICRLYMVVTTSATPPSAAQIKAGQDHTGAAAAFADDIVTATTGLQPTFSVTGLAHSTLYYAYFMSEDSSDNQSNIASASDTTDVISAPSAFVSGNCSLTAGDEQAGVVISALPNNGGSAITDIEYRLDGGSWVSSGGTTSFTITGLTNDQEYDVELRAVNAIGAGAASDMKSVTPVVGGSRILQENDDLLLLETTDPVQINDDIPAQPAADPLDGTEWTVIVQGGTTKKVSTADLAEFIYG